MKKISLVLPCFNEEENINNLYRLLLEEIEKNKLNDKYFFEFLFIDNHSTDNTREVIRGLCKKDNRVKAIFNSQNFGHIRSPYYGLTQATGDAAILMASDLQDPPEMLPLFIKKWEEGNKIVIATKNKSREKPLMFLIRKGYYRLIKKISEVKMISQFCGYGLYDKSFIKVLGQLKDSYPYFRGIISELGFNYVTIPFTQPRRERGITKNNFYTLYDMAMLGITSYSKKPLRYATLYGVFLSFFSGLSFFSLLILKIIYTFQKFGGNFFELALSYNHLIIALIIFLFSVLLTFIGILGEYIAMINIRTMARPLVVEEERINFEE